MSLLQIIRHRLDNYRWFGLGGPTRAYRDAVIADRPIPFRVIMTREEARAALAEIDRQNAEHVAYSEKAIESLKKLAATGSVE